MKLLKLKRLLLITLLLISCTGGNNHDLQKNNNPPSTTINSKVLILSGDYVQMGTQYGELLNLKLRSSLRIMKDFYITQHGLVGIKWLLKQINFMQDIQMNTNNSYLA